MPKFKASKKIENIALKDLEADERNPMEDLKFEEGTVLATEEDFLFIDWIGSDSNNNTKENRKNKQSNLEIEEDSDED